MTCITCNKNLREHNKSGMCSKHYRIWWDKNKRDPTKKKNYSKEWYLKNKEKQIKNHKIYREKNKEALREYEAKRARDPLRIKKSIDANTRRLKTDLNFKLRVYLRNRIYLALKGKWKSVSAVKNLGCSIEELRKHIESKFKTGMTWDNWGEWHLDHIRPLSSFKLQNEEDQKLAVHFTNLQPLWARDNILKGNKLWQKFMVN